MGDIMILEWWKFKSSDYMKIEKVKYEAYYIKTKNNLIGL